MNLAAASGEDLGLVSDIVTDSMTAFGIEADKAGSFADLLATTSSNANTTVGMLGESFKYTAPVAGALGYSAEDTALALGLMANSGIKASQSGTSMRQIMSRLVKPTKESAEAMEKLGLQVKNSDGSMRPFKDVMVDLRSKFSKLTDSEKASVASNLAGQTAMSGLLAIVNAGEGDFDKLSGAIDNSDGSAKKMADVMGDNLAGKMTRLKSSLEGLGIQFGEILIPIIGELVDKYIAPLIKRFNDLSPKTKKIIVVVGILAAVLGPLIAVAGAVVTGFGALAGALTAVSLPIVAVVAGIALLVAGFLYLWNTNEGFRNGVIAIWEAIKTFFMTIFNAIKSVVIEVWDGLKQFWEEHGESIKKDFEEKWNKIKTFFSEIFDTIVEKLKEGVKIFRTIWELFGDNILSYFDTCFELISAGLSNAFDILSGLLDIFIGVFTGDWETFWDGIKGVAEGFWNGIEIIFDGLMEHINNIKDAFVKAKNFFTGAKTEADEATKKIQNPTQKNVTESDVYLDIPWKKNSKEVKVKKFAEGGLVTRPTLGLIGEAGESEAVIPLSKMGSLGSKQVNITISGNNINDSMDLEIIANRLAKELILQGVQ
jgi:TP901 family phage tail tape measure protein